MALIYLLIPVALRVCTSSTDLPIKVAFHTNLAEGERRTTPNLQRDASIYYSIMMTRRAASKLSEGEESAIPPPIWELRISNKAHVVVTVIPRAAAAPSSSS
jgi:hypothetical protein